MTIQRTLVSLSLLTAVLGGCDNDDPKEDLREARAEHREAIEDANEELSEAYAEANEDMKEHEDDIVDGSKHADLDRDRFEALKDESDSEFVARANARISAIEEDLNDVDASADDRKDVDEQLAEARGDLKEFKGDKFADDGKLGVTVALNSAERKLERLAKK